MSPVSTCPGFLTKAAHQVLAKADVSNGAWRA